VRALLTADIPEISRHSTSIRQSVDVESITTEADGTRWEADRGPAKLRVDDDGAVRFVDSCNEHEGERSRFDGQDDPGAFANVELVE
jgi:hypothetical protein